MQLPSNADRVTQAVNVMRRRYSRHITVVDIFPLLVGMTFDDIDEAIEDCPELETDSNGAFVRCPEIEGEC